MSNFKTMRKWQKECVDFFEGNRRNILNAFTGSGKSLVMQSLNHKWLTSNKKLFSVIAVPQICIGNGFERADVIIDGEEVTIQPDVISQLENINSTVDHLYNFLTQDPKSFKRVDQRMIVCTHATLIMMFNKYNGVAKELFKNVVLWIDEAHHIETILSNEGVEEEEIKNRLAEVVDYCMKKEYRVNLTTATLFRSNKSHILHPETMKLFEARYNLPFDRYISEVCKYLKTVDHEWMFYSKKYTNGITDAFKEAPEDRTIIYIDRAPNGLNQSENAEHKNTQVKETLQAINPKSKLVEEFNKVYGCRYYTIKLNGKKLICVDLVDTDKKNRKGTYDFIASENKKENPIIDVIVSVSTFKEGGDYQSLQRVIIVGQKRSIVDNCQIAGRVVRDYLDQPYAKIISLLPKYAKANYGSDEEIKNILNNRIKAFIVHMLLDDRFTPKGEYNIKIKKNVDKKTDIVESSTDIWDIEFKEKAIEVMEELAKEILTKRGEIKGMAKEELDEVTEKSSDEFLKKAGVKDPKVRGILFKEFKAKLKKAFPKNDTVVGSVDVQLIDISIVEIWEMFDGFLAQGMGTKMIDKMREAVKGLNSADANKAILIEMAKSGEKRPNQRTTKLGMALNHYTNKGPSYDAVFDAEIRKLAPHWFENTADTNKAILIEMAKNGEKRPVDKTPLGKALIHYTGKSDDCYSAKFDAEIRKLAPQWFESTADVNKAILIEMAKNGEDRPHCKTKIGSALVRYTNKSDSYNTVFDAEIRKLAPKWFESTADINKSILIEMAKNGEKRPSKRTTEVGSALIKYTNKGPSYDAVFDAEIRKLAPQWFKK